MLDIFPYPRSKKMVHKTLDYIIRAKPGHVQLNLSEKLCRHVQLDPVMYSRIRSNTGVKSTCRIRSDRVRSHLVVYGRTRSCMVEPGCVWSNPDVYGQIRSRTVRCGHVRSSTAGSGQKRSVKTN
jgi:hypothetical protein